MRGRGPAGDAAGTGLHLDRMERAAARSHSGGVWSLTHLRICWLALAGATVVLAGAGLAVGGPGAGVGALLGALIVGVFFTVSAVLIAKIGARQPKAILPTALGAYVVKIVALGAVLTVLPRDGFLDTRWMAGAVAVGLFVWLGAHLRYVWTAKIFYVDPG